MKIQKTLLILALSGTLVACGSSSSQGSHAPKPNNQGTQKDTNKKNDKNDKKDEKDQGDTHNPTPEHGILNDKAGKHLVLVDKPTQNINKFVLDGQEIDLIPNGFTVGGIHKQVGSSINGDTLDRAVSGTRYQVSRFGIIAPAGKDAFAFSQGMHTAVGDLPSGTAVKYKGDYVAYSLKNKTFLNNGTFDATVNFADKTLKLKPDHDDSDGLPAHITGNTFTFDDGKGKGRFYGSQAAELGGVYQDDQIVAFGGKKQ